ncbi:hypothetical protein [uncultured Thiothrix sp.]|uniref:hypothetical protein n=1 Tax=uncultured Thiothrix sp. TaxID=223185 RepID=UPI002605BA13|nr:hypothetical protein [uncultured Thiothrix sp.]
MKAVTLLLVIFILGVGGYLALQAWPPFQSNSPKRITLISSKNCWLNESICTAEHESVQLSLELAPHPVPLMKPVQVTMQLKAVNNLESASLKIEGENMYMGFQNVLLTKQNDSEWQGNFSLPVCSEAEMHWRVTATLNASQQVYQASFKLATQR